MRDQPAVDLFVENNASFAPARTASDWLSRDPDEVDRYVADPMCGDDHPLTYGYLIDLFDVLAPARGQLASITCPSSSSPGTKTRPRGWEPTHHTCRAHAEDGECRRRHQDLRRRAPRAPERDEQR